MIKNTEVIIDQDGIELWVSYRAEKNEQYYEEGHGYHLMGGGYDVQLTSVEIIIANRSIELLDRLTEKQTDKIIDLLSID